MEIATIVIMIKMVYVNSEKLIHLRTIILKNVMV